MSARAAERLSRLPIFTAEAYLAANPDVARAGVDAVEHALTRGTIEGRTLFADTALARFYGQIAERSGSTGPARPRSGSGALRGPAGPSSPPTAGTVRGQVRPPRPGASGPGSDEAPKAGRRCSVFLHSSSDEAYRETARALVADLAALGFEAVASDERADPSADHGITVFVAPHDFFRLGLGPLWADSGILDESFVVIDDPVESREGGQCLWPLLRARGVIEFSAVGAGIWAAAGIPTFHLRPRVRLRDRWLDASDLDHPLMLAAPDRARKTRCDPLGGDGRAIDLLYFGRESPARNASLGRLAAGLAPHRCFVYAQQSVGAKADERLHRGAHWRISGHLSAQARLTLNLSEGRFPSLDRRRVVVQAMAGGSTVVSAARFAEPGLEPGRHYFHDDLGQLGGLVDWLLREPDGRRAADAARERAFDGIAAANGAGHRLAGLRAFLLGPGDPDGGAS